MMIHISLDGVGAIHAEWARAYGRSPAWKMSHFGQEILLDIPYGRVIITPPLRNPVTGHAHKKKRTSNFRSYFFNRAGWDSDEKSKRPSGADGAAAGITER